MRVNIAFEHPAAEDDDYALSVGTEGMWHLHDFEISGVRFSGAGEGDKGLCRGE